MSHDVAVRHSVFFASSLVNVRDVHPAAQGYTDDASDGHSVLFAKSLAFNDSDLHPAAAGYTQSYEVAIRHPVFFAKSLICNLRDVHPAAQGYTYYSTGSTDCFKYYSSDVE